MNTKLETRWPSRCAGLLLLLSGVILPGVAGAGRVELTLGLEPGAALPRSPALASDINFGYGGLLRVGIMPTSWLEISATGGGFLLEPSPKSTTGQQSIVLAGGGLRLQTPHAGRIVAAWVAGDLLFASGGGNRLAFDVSAGLGFPAGKVTPLWLGLYFRYLELITPDSPGVDSTDPKLLIAGIYFEWRPLKAKVEVVVAQDADQDGTPDDQDHCPAAPGPKENGGCPWPDTDGDEVLDKDDKCRTEKGPKENFGCPWSDSDLDGLTDNLDKCPEKKGPVENEGCPWPDTDNDGMNDKNDECPFVAGPAANLGCPAYKDVVVSEAKILALEPVTFALDATSGERDKIAQPSLSVLDQVAQAVKDKPKVRLRVESHTDNSHAEPQNLKLTDARAKAIKKYLVDHGVAEARLEAQGFGSSKPLETGAGATRDHNNRIEFVVIP